MIQRGSPGYLTAIQDEIQQLNGCLRIEILNMLVTSEQLRFEELMNDTASFQVLNSDELKKQSTEGVLHFHVILTYVDRTTVVDEEYLENLRTRRAACMVEEAEAGE